MGEMEAGRTTRYFLFPPELEIARLRPDAGRYPLDRQRQLLLISNSEAQASSLLIYNQQCWMKVIKAEGR